MKYILEKSRYLAIVGVISLLVAAVAVLTLPIFFTGNRIERWEGWLFLFYYVAYTAYLILDAAQHDALPLLNSVLLSASSH